MSASRATTDLSQLCKHPPRTSALSTDKPGERLSLWRLPGLEGVEFCSVSGSTRLWNAYHETYTVSHLRGPESLTASWHYRGREQSAHAGDLQLMEPGEVHTTRRLSEPAAFFVVCWPKAVIQRAAEAIGLRDWLHFKQPQVTSTPLALAFAALQAALERGYDALEVEECFAEATRKLLESCFESRPQPANFGAQHPAVRKARAFLDARFPKNTTLDQLAAETGLSKFHFAHVFAEVVGVPPHRYQALRRVATARRRLQAGDSLKQAVIAAGFADEAHLTRWFKREVGVSPGVWRRALRSS
jgi:AraC-like DNA-binding protein